MLLHYDNSKNSTKSCPDKIVPSTFAALSAEATLVNKPMNIVSADDRYEQQKQTQRTKIGKHAEDMLKIRQMTYAPQRCNSYCR